MYGQLFLRHNLNRASPAGPCRSRPAYTKDSGAGIKSVNSSANSLEIRKVRSGASDCRLGKGRWGVGLGSHGCGIVSSRLRHHVQGRGPGRRSPVGGATPLLPSGCPHTSTVTPAPTGASARITPRRLLEQVRLGTLEINSPKTA